MTTADAYLERAAECRREANGTSLANVRETYIRSALAWESMAARAQLAEVYRESELERKAEQQTMEPWYR
jgi:hypothetical protein